MVILICSFENLNVILNYLLLTLNDVDVTLIYDEVFLIFWKSSNVNAIFSAYFRSADVIWMPDVDEILILNVDEILILSVVVISNDF